MEAVDLLTASLPLGMPIVKEGVRILGAPVGNSLFWESFSREIVNSITKDIDVLARLPSLQAQHLIATKSIQHRVNHLLRNIPGGCCRT